MVQGVEGQQGPAVVLEASVDGQQPQLVGQVAQPRGQGVLAAVDHAGVHEGRERVDLVADGDVALGAGRAGAEERDAVPLVLDAGVIGWDLRCRERPRGLAAARNRGQEWSTLSGPPTFLGPEFPPGKQSGTQDQSGSPGQ